MTNPAAIVRSSATRKLDKWLETLVAEKGSDLLLIPGAPASIRLEGAVKSIGSELLDGAEIEAIVAPALTPHALEDYQEKHIADSSYRIPGVGRFRINLHHQQGMPAAAIRTFPSRVPIIKELNLPRGVESLAQLPRGLVLVGGPAGSGKSTTLAALVHEINRSKLRHIITIEDPIEHEHPHLRGLIEQVEIGLDAPDFPTALRAAVRQAPDVIVVGEMRDSETMRIAVAAAETGHLVLSTLHTTDIASTVSRISDSFPIERQNAVRQELAMALAAVLPSSAAQQARRARSRRRIADTRLRRPATHPPQLASASSPRDYDDQEQRLVHVRGISCATDQEWVRRPRGSAYSRLPP